MLARLKSGDLSYLRMALRSALPLVISLSLLSAISLVDIFLAGQIGEAAQAAMGIAEQVVFLNMIMLTGLCAGMNAKISQAFGAGNLLEVSELARHGTYVAVIFGIVATVAGVLSADALASAFTSDGLVREQAAQYIRICAFANLWWAGIMCQTTIFRAVDKAHLGTYEWLIATAVCVGLELFCFYGLNGCRSLVSLAVSWNLAAPVGVLYGWAMLKRAIPFTGAARMAALPGIAFAVSAVETYRVDSTVLAVNKFWKDAKGILRIAIPVMVGEMCWLISNLALYVLLRAVPAATSAQAAWTITLRIEETLAYVPLTACSLATATVVGHAMGGGRDEEGRRVAWVVAQMTCAGMFGLGALTWLLAPHIVQNFSGDLQVQRIASILLSGCVIAFPLNALALVCSAALEGRGETVRPMIANVVGLFAVRVPTAWLLAMPLGAGVIGIWLGKIISNLVLAVLMVLAFNPARAHAFAASTRVTRTSPAAG